ncbi:DNA gyrase subunit A [Spiroplasma turonicum]|uniref:DNA topoisomerase (ATP-hydrolyzing) n=1 Tax=Spiroplasma turonicum TaxID=216946 RepID=A0A0K1P4M4_9MOLU|nr:DNA gyrase subunit A [Spiroplasma turonicum]AKU79250.1 DNA gyrase subunit A [Spiroplasma turonicum]ALX70273.1 DNA gyrase subunit A [Spiroplasma turonicum]
MKNINNTNSKILEVDIKTEVERDFLEYSMSVIVSRALPDLRDGLKPVQRRIVYAMNELKIFSDTPHKKSARIVGEVIGKYHPHGDSSVYEAMVRMAQDFSYRYPLVEGHGNFGSIDGDGAAAMRYTEARLAKISSLLLKDIDMETVPFVDNYDAIEKEPVYLTGYFPNLLVNGATGIAVGMATNIPPHNLTEVVNAIVETIKDDKITIEKILTFIKGPDFPMGALMTNGKSMIEGYKTGKGSVTLRAKILTEQTEKKSRIIITEIPYQTNKLRIVEKIAELYKNKIIIGISDIRDESNYQGIRIVVELNKNANVQLIIKKLYKYTNLQYNFPINMLALNNGKPEVLNIRDLIKLYINHQVSMIVKRSIYEKNKLDEKLHILNALKITIDNIEEVIKIIKESKTTSEASINLTSRFGFDERQIKAILDMRLQRLVSLEHEKIVNEIEEIIKRINYLITIIDSKEIQEKILIEQLVDIKNKFGDARRTEIIEEEDTQIEEEELIQDDQFLLTLTKDGYIRRIKLEEIKTQKRGGKGTLLNPISEDEIIISTIGKTKDEILFFTNIGKVYKIKGYKIPISSKNSRGIPLVNYIGISQSEKVTSVLCYKHNKSENLFLLTEKGIAKRLSIKEFEKINNIGKLVIILDDKDKLVSVVSTKGNENLLIASLKGKILRSSEDNFRTMSRGSRGVIAIKLDNDDKVVSACSTTKNTMIVTISDSGILKKTLIEEINLLGRGSKGILGMKLNEKTGNLKYIFSIRETDEIIMISSDGKTIKLLASDINLQSRKSTGVIGFDIIDSEHVSSVSIKFNK